MLNIINILTRSRGFLTGYTLAIMVRAALRGAETLEIPRVAGVDSMAGGSREDDRSVKPPDEAALSARLRRLGNQLDREGANRHAKTDPGARAGADASALGRGLRLSAELVGGVIVGAGIGWGFDRLLGTSPWGFIGFVMLGFAGGVLSVMRSAGVIPERRL